MRPITLLREYFDNRATFNSDPVVGRYATSVELQKPEATILELLRPRLGAMRMLDIGVGTGRTTLHFAPLAKEYLGIDYAPAMAEYCRNRFVEFPGHPVFRCHDARGLESLEPGRFDFILFSYNGLDFVGHEDRLRILAQVRARLNPGGLFCFSTHNIQALIGNDRKRPRSWRDFATRTLFLALNSSAGPLERKDWAVLRDGAQAFRIRNYCIRPEAQLRQLDEAGFRNARVFSLEEGTEIPAPGDWTARLDRWLYFLCGN